MLNVLDVSLKPQQEPHKKNYISKDANHPLATLKQLPISMKTKPSKLLLSEKIFDISITIYQEILQKPGYYQI